MAADRSTSPIPPAFRVNVPTEHPTPTHLKYWHYPELWDGDSTVPSVYWNDAIRELVIGNSAAVHNAGWPLLWIFPHNKKITPADAKELVSQARFAYRLGYTYQVLCRRENFCQGIPSPPSLKWVAFLNKNYLKDVTEGTHYELIRRFIQKFHEAIREHMATLRGQESNYNLVSEFETRFLEEGNLRAGTDEYEPDWFINPEGSIHTSSHNRVLPFIMGLFAAKADMVKVDEIARSGNAKEGLKDFSIRDFDNLE